jgi:hypothetical protein
MKRPAGRKQGLLPKWFWRWAFIFEKSTSLKHCGEQAEEQAGEITGNHKSGIYYKADNLLTQNVAYTFCSHVKRLLAGLVHYQ